MRTAAAISAGTPLMRLDTSAVARRVETLPAVAAATVRTDYPTTVMITVVERTAVGYVAAGHGYRLVDRTGDQYRAEPAKPHGLPLFVVPVGGQAKATGRADRHRRRRPERQAAGPRRLDPGVRPDRDHVAASTTGGVVRWGSAARSADKARILPALLHQPGTTFDVTDPDQVVAR